jgi:aspartate/methionine/tyrosine aminotransferase
MKISKRAQSVAPFLAMEIGKQAAALEAQGRSVVKLNIGEPDTGAPPAVLEALRAQCDGRPLPYSAALGLPELRQAIAGFYAAQHGLDIDAARIVVTAGASAALLLVTAALVDPGDEVLVGDPSYPCNSQFLAGFGAQVRRVPTDAGSRFQLDAERVRAHWSARTRGVMLATPSNPTGTSIAPTELSAVLDCTAAHGAWTLVDEIYLNLQDADAAGRAPASALALSPDVCVINSFSKYFGMTGWRLGWCVLPAELVFAVERLAQNYYICPPVTAQQAALACFTPESIAVCEARRTEFSRRRKHVLAGLERIGLAVPVAPDGAFYAWFDVSATGLDAWDFCQRALLEAGVALTPGRDFSVQSAARFVRLSCATSMAELDEGLARLGQFVSRL